MGLNQSSYLFHFCRPKHKYAIVEAGPALHCVTAFPLTKTNFSLLFSLASFCREDICFWFYCLRCFFFIFYFFEFMNKLKGVQIVCLQISLKWFNLSYVLWFNGYWFRHRVVFCKAWGWFFLLFCSSGKLVFSAFWYCWFHLSFMGCIWWLCLCF